MLILVVHLLFLANSIQATQPSISAAVFADRDTVIVGSQAGVRVLSWPDQKVRKTLTTGLEHVHDLTVSPDGSWLAMAGGMPGESGSIELVRWPSGEAGKRLTGHEDVVTAIAWSADGKRLVSASVDGSCQVFEVATGKRVCTFKGHAGSVLAATWMPDGKQVLSAGVDQSLRLWDAATGKVLRVLENHTKTVNGLALRPGQAEETLPLVASVGSDKTVRLWQPTIGRMMRFKRLPSAVQCVAWTGDGRQLIVGGTDGILRVIEPDTLDVIAEKKLFERWVTTLAVWGKDVLASGEKGQLERVTLPDRPQGK